MDEDNKEIRLWEGEIPYFDDSVTNDENAGTATITPYLINDGKKHACIIILAGGGYVKRTWHEGGEAAGYINSIGLHAFVVNYRVAPYRAELGIVDAKRAVRFVRYHAGRFMVVPDKIGMLGFSAGGGLACYTALRHDMEDYEYIDEIDKVSSRPDSCCLSYAALSLKKDRLIEKDYENFRKYFDSDEDYEAYLLANSCEYLVREDMPPVFLWHTIDDARIPVVGSIDFIAALKEKGIPFECHFFPDGGHGLGISRALMIEGTREWFALYTGWLKRMGYV